MYVTRAKLLTSIIKLLKFHIYVIKEFNWMFSSLSMKCPGWGYWDIRWHSLFIFSLQVSKRHCLKYYLKRQSTSKKVEHFLLEERYKWSWQNLNGYSETDQSWLRQHLYHWKSVVTHNMDLKSSILKHIENNNISYMK